ncbi:MAG: hypothetical protein M1499_07415 [Firmicutes bacterium]|nr:hypothetical protein [Bacillota bacterium]
MESSKPGANNHHESPDKSGLRRVGDREANIYDVFVDAQTAPYGVLVRSARDRCLVDPEGYLWAAMESTDILGTVEVGSAQGGTALRQAMLTLQATTLDLQIPTDRKADNLGTPRVQIVLPKKLIQRRVSRRSGGSCSSPPPWSISWMPSGSFGGTPIAGGANACILSLKQVAATSRNCN